MDGYGLPSTIIQPVVSGGKEEEEEEEGAVIRNLVWMDPRNEMGNWWWASLGESSHSSSTAQTDEEVEGWYQLGKQLATK